jgi:hypothetical protein
MGLTKDVFVTAMSLASLLLKSAILLSIFLSNFKPYSERIPGYQGPRGNCLMKKTRGRKSRVRVSLSLYFDMPNCYSGTGTFLSLLTPSFYLGAVLLWIL